MKAGLSTVQQTLNPEAASILNHAITEACCHGHGRTIPLHVAVTFWAAPTSHLRQAARLQLQGLGDGAEATGNKNDEIRRLIEILLKVKKKNPVLVGEKEPEAIEKILVQRIEKGETPAQLQILHIETYMSAFCSGNKDKDHIAMKFRELDQMVERRLFNVGELKRLVEHPKVGGALIGLSEAEALKLQRNTSYSYQVNLKFQFE